MPNYRRYHLADRPVFLTLVTHRRQPWLTLPGRTSMLMTAMRRVREKHPYRHWAHVVLPDHLHWLIEAQDGDFSRIVAALKRELTWRLKEDGGMGMPPYWQARFYDHLIRDDADFERHLDYIHYNPVRHGHAHRADAWPDSSFQAWVERGRYAVDWGSTAPRNIENLNLE